MFVNNNLIASKSFSPRINVATLRTYLTLEIPKECNFLQASKQTLIQVEKEESFNISQIYDENSNIYIKSEQKNKTSNNKPIDKAEFLRKEGNLDIYLFPLRKFIIGNPNSSENEKKNV